MEGRPITNSLPSDLVADFTSVDPDISSRYTAKVVPKRASTKTCPRHLSQPALTSNSYENGERLAGRRRTVVQTCFEQNVGNRRSSGSNSGIRTRSQQDAGLHHLGHPVDCSVSQTLPRLLRRRMLVQGFCGIGRTLRGTVASSDANRERSHSQENDDCTAALAP